MSVESDFYFVDWPLLVAGYEGSGGTDCIADALEAEAPWLEEAPISGSSAYLLTSWSAYTDFTEIFDSLANSGAVKEEDEKRMRAFFESVGCLQRDGALRPTQELTPEVDSWVFAAISPQSVVRLLNDSQRLSFEPYMEGLDELVRGKADTAFAGGEQLQQLLLSWRAILKEASDRGLGVLVLAG